MFEPKYRLDEDLSVEDNLLDGFTFEDIILQVHCNCKKIDEKAVRMEVKELFELRMEDMMELLNRNIDVIIEKALEGRKNYDAE